MKERRVLVTGAGGFVGRELAVGFAELGWRVIGLDRAFDPRRGDEGITRVTAELSDGVPKDVPQVDLVVHAAWVTKGPGRSGVGPVDYMTLNLTAMLAALTFAVRTGPAAFVFLSSSGVFAPTDGGEGLTDGDRPTGRSAYGAAKRAGEILAPAALGQDGSALDQPTAVHVVRLGYLFGPGEVPRASRPRVSPVATWLAAARAGRPLEVRSDDPSREWTFTPDLAGALARVVEGPPAGHPVHLGSPYVWRDSAVAELICSQVPGVETVTVPATGKVKPPMVPSDIPALQGFGWTDPPAGIQVLLEEEVAA